MSDLNEPVLPGTAATDYERYLRTDELLALQKTPEQVVHRDEHLFQAVHQSSELWLKLACQEIEDAANLVEGDRVSASTRLVRRANDAMTLITQHLHMLEHMSPVDYAVVRTALGHGAGFDSPGFRRVHRVSPELGETFDRLLARRQLTLIGVYRARIRARRHLSAGRTADHLGRTHDSLALSTPQDRRAHHRRQRHRHAGHTGGGPRQTDRPPILPGALARQG